MGWEDTCGFVLDVNAEGLVHEARVSGRLLEQNQATLANERADQHGGDDEDDDTEEGSRDGAVIAGVASVGEALDPDGAVGHS